MTDDETGLGWHVIEKGLAWAVAFAAVFAFYAHTLLGAPSSELTPRIALAIAGGLCALAYFGFLRLSVPETSSRARGWSSFLLTIALFLAFASTVGHAISDAVLVPEWGVAAVTFGVPILIGLSAQRRELLRAIGVVSVLFATLDLALDGLDYAGIAHLAAHSGRTGSEYGLHYLGAAGSTLATGLVGFLAVSYVASGFATGSFVGNIVRLAVILLLLVSIYLSGTRTYLAAALVAAAILVAPGNRRAPLVLIGTVMAALFVYLTLNWQAGDRDNQLRSMLMVDGFDDALRRPFLGSGPEYLESGTVVATYSQLHSAGVVESGFLQFAIFYGVPAAFMLVLASSAAQGARRPRQNFASVVLCMMTSVLLFNEPIGSFLGSITFYTALIYCQRDEFSEHEI